MSDFNTSDEVVDEMQLEIENLKNENKQYKKFCNDWMFQTVEVILLQEEVEQLKKERVSSKIIAMSGGGRIDSEHYLRLVQAYGVEFTIDKPFGGEKLICLIERVLKNSE